MLSARTLSRSSIALAAAFDLASSTRRRSIAGVTLRPSSVTMRYGLRTPRLALVQKALHQYPQLAGLYFRLKTYPLFCRFSLSEVQKAINHVCRPGGPCIRWTLIGQIAQIHGIAQLGSGLLVDSSPDRRPCIEVPRCLLVFADTGRGVWAVSNAPLLCHVEYVREKGGLSIRPDLACPSISILAKYLRCNQFLQAQGLLGRHIAAVNRGERELPIVRFSSQIGSADLRKIGRSLWWQLTT